MPSTITQIQHPGFPLGWPQSTPSLGGAALAPAPPLCAQLCPAVPLAAGPSRLSGGSGSPQQLQMINPGGISFLPSALESIVSPAFKDTLVGSPAMLFCFGGIPLKQ